MAGYSGLTLVTNPFSALIALGGTELTDSRRYADLWDIEAARVQYKSSGALQVRVEYSRDAGETWSTLIPDDSTSGNNPYVSPWHVIPDDARAADVLLRAVGVGSGLLTTISYVEMSFR